MNRKISVYVPITAGELRAVRDGALPSPVTVYFSDLPEDEFGPDDLEQAQFDSLCDAAAASVEKLTEASSMTPLRAVVVARVAGTAPVLQDDGSYVIGSLPWTAVDAIYIDELAAARDVETLVATVKAGREPTDTQYDAVENRLMLWHDPSEIDNLIEAYER